MTEDSAIWMFLSICAICFTWYKIAAVPRKAREPDDARDLKFIYNGKPIDGSLELIVDGKASIFRLVGGKIQ